MNIKFIVTRVTNHLGLRMCLSQNIKDVQRLLNLYLSEAT